MNSYFLLRPISRGPFCVGVKVKEADDVVSFLSTLDRTCEQVTLGCHQSLLLEGLTQSLQGLCDAWLLCSTLLWVLGARNPGCFFLFGAWMEPCIPILAPAKYWTVWKKFWKGGIKDGGTETGLMLIPWGHTSICALSAASIKVLLHTGVQWNQQLGDVGSEKCYQASQVEWKSSESVIFFVTVLHSVRVWWMHNAWEISFLTPGWTPHKRSEHWKATFYLNLWRRENKWQLPSDMLKSWGMSLYCW